MIFFMLFTDFVMNRTKVAHAVASEGGLIRQYVGLLRQAFYSRMTAPFRRYLAAIILKTAPFPLTLPLTKHVID